MRELDVFAGVGERRRRAAGRSRASPFDAVEHDGDDATGMKTRDTGSDLLIPCIQIAALFGPL